MLNEWHSNKLLCEVAEETVVPDELVDTGQGRVRWNGFGLKYHEEKSRIGSSMPLLVLQDFPPIFSTSIKSTTLTHHESETKQR